VLLLNPRTPSYSRENLRYPESVRWRRSRRSVGDDFLGENLDVDELGDGDLCVDDLGVGDLGDDDLGVGDLGVGDLGVGDDSLSVLVHCSV